MTWIVGANSFMGYGTVVSDTCVTFENGFTANLVQKSYPVGRFVVAGFAGGVKNGFILLEDLVRYLEEPDLNRAWDPEWVAETWSGRAMRIYENNPEYMKDIETHILITGAHPTENAGFQGCAKIIGVVLKSPDFHPEFHFGGLDIYSIGSGGHVERYRELLAEIRKDFGQLFQMEIGNTGGYGRALDMLINQAIEDNPVQGISSYLHHFIVGRNHISGGATGRTDYRPDGSTIVHPRPPVATNWPELVRMASEISVRARVETAVG
jgi:hypothetical protein